MNLFNKKFDKHGIAEATRNSMRASYKKHLVAAQQGNTPLNGGITPHSAGLYGTLATRYMAAGIPKQETFLWSELAPFLLMNTSDSVEALAEYVVCQELAENGKKEWLQEMINNALRTVPDTNNNWKGMAVTALIQPTIYWHGLLDQDTKGILKSEFLKMFPSENSM